MEFFNTLIFLGSAQAFIMTLFLFKVKENSTPNRLLSIMTFSWSVCCLIFGLQSREFWSANPHLFKIGSGFTLTFFPPIYLYTRYLTKGLRKFDKRDLLHFLPVLIYIIAYTPFFILDSDTKLDIIFRRPNAPLLNYMHVASIVIDFTVLLQGMVYTFLALKLLRDFNERIKQLVSDIGNLTFSWLQKLIIINAFCWLMGSIAAMLDLFDIQFDLLFYQVCYLFIVGIIYFISYYALKQPNIFQEMVNAKVEVDTEISEIVEEPVSEEIVDESLEENAKKLREYIETYKPYLNKKLVLQDIVDAFGGSRNQLSTLIFYTFKKKFYDVMNEYRIEEAKVLLKERENLDIKIEYIISQAGFNSKATFNKCFKVSTGMTPSEYRKQHTEMLVTD